MKLEIWKEVSSRNTFLTSHIFSLVSRFQELVTRHKYYCSSLFERKDEYREDGKKKKMERNREER